MSQSPHILLVEDDAEIRRLVIQYLRGNRFEVSVLSDGRGLEQRLEDSRVDLVVLDRMLPDEDGLNLCCRLRTHSNIPVIMLTAKGGEDDRIAGLEMGADDYLAKPFNPRELLARIHAVLRRANAPLETAKYHARRLRFSGWEMDRQQREVTDPTGIRIVLTGAEFCLLLVLCERAGQVLSRDDLLNLTQGPFSSALARSIDVLVARLRRKIERDPHRPEIIKTVRSGGYLFAASIEAI